MKKLQFNFENQHPFQNLMNIIFVTMFMLFLLYAGNCLGEYFTWMEQNAKYLDGQTIDKVILSNF